MAIQDFTKDELLAELVRREAKEKTKSPPPMLAQPNFQELQRAVFEYANRVARDGFERGNDEQYIFSKAVEAVYGPGFWKWFNSVVK